MILDIKYHIKYQQWNQRILGIISTGTTKSANSILIKIISTIVPKFGLDWGWFDLHVNYSKID